ncbi:MAG: hypothetical protein A4S12_07260 [Proteobacteria bacterium SG_bin5]|nr:cell division protein ZapA [Sphingomonas sp.]OQW41997.1 MAG: hypothetical protein A4S12_07260 [Proteobacteria bacterium SG_bin5]
MAEVVIALGGRLYPVACADGQEDHLRALGATLADLWPQAQRAAGAAPAERVLLLIALMLADALAEARAAPSGLDAARLDQVAARLEALAESLEEGAQNP